MSKDTAIQGMLPPKEDWPILLPIPGVSYPKRLNASEELLDRNIEKGRSKNVAVFYGEQQVTYGELKERVDSCSTALVKAGVKKGDRVLLRMMNTPDFVVAWLAILRVGGIVLATLPLLRERELRLVLHDSGTSLAICQASLVKELQECRTFFPNLRIVVSGGGLEDAGKFEDWLREPPLDGAVETEADDIAILAYTSGSTGVPKGTIHSHQDILAIADSYSRNVLQPDATDVFSGHPSLAFTFGLGALLVFPFRVGAGTVFIDRFTPETMLETTRNFGVTILFCAPTSYKMMLREYGAELKSFLPKLRLGVSAGETLPGSVFREWKERTGVTILDGIGATELLHIFISSRPDDVQPDCTGKVVPGFEAKVVDKNLKEVPPGTEGLLAVRGPTGCRYWNRPELQREYVKGGWNFPGDIFSRDQDDYFYYSCRADDMIICGGINIGGPEVEKVMLEHPAVKDVAVVASPDELKGFIPKAFVILNQEFVGEDHLSEELQAFVKENLAPFKYPRKIAYVTDLPRTSTGKIKRVELRQKELARVEES